MAKVQRVLQHPAHSEMVHVSGIVHKGPCIITGFTVTEFGSKGWAKLYDGENNLSKLKCTIAALDDTTASWPITNPVDFDNGIYIEVNDSNTWAIICYIPESWKDFI